MEIGVAVLCNSSIPETIRFSKSVEDAGYYQLWIADGTPSPGFRDPTVCLTTIGMNTFSIRIGTQLLNPYTLHPAKMATLSASLMEAINRPFDLGIGVGGSLTLGPIGALMWDRPIRAMRETVKILQLLQNSSPIKYKGELFSALETHLDPLPAYPFRIFMGAQGPKMLQLAGEIADGILLTCPMPYVKATLNEIKKGLKKSHRTFNDIYICNYIATNIHTPGNNGNTLALRKTVSYLASDTSDQIHEACGLSIDAVHQIRDALHSQTKNPEQYLTDEILNAFSVQGTPKECFKIFEHQNKMGINQIIIGAPYGNNPIQALQYLAVHQLKKSDS